LEFSGTEQELVKIAYDLAWQRAEHKARMDQIEAEARRALEQQYETPEEMREVQEEFYPEGVVLEANLPQDQPCIPKEVESTISLESNPESPPSSSGSSSNAQEVLVLNPLAPAESEMVPITWDPPPVMIDLESHPKVEEFLAEEGLTVKGEGKSREPVKSEPTKRRRRTGPKKNLPSAPPHGENAAEDKPQLF
jgi:hypothetical protein